ncbi:MAG: SDR family oxidoreductase [Desulfobacterales bacterium]
MMTTEHRQFIFITGAASGMGRATAKLFAEKGWFIGAFDVNAAGLETLREELGADHCFAQPLDVTDKAAFDRAVAAFGEVSGGKLDLLYNNAGIGAGGFFEEIPFEKTLEVVQVNLIGVLNGIHAALPLLKNTPNALCFTTSSSAATYGAPGLAVYAATKHGVKGLTEALSVEFRRLNIRAADVLPGLIDTAILRTTDTYENGEPVERDMEEYLKNAPTEGTFRLIPAEAVADVVWQAYHSEKLHWYVPEELAEIDKAKGDSPESVREMYAGMQETGLP